MSHNWNFTKTEMSQKTEMSCKTDVAPKPKMLPKLKFYSDWNVTKSQNFLKMKC